ncbi:MAG TPA: twin-arginine translocase subunit TatC [Phycisphaerae bacterium]|nr:twin-arginine translocase subunit TatC [Phycisphaerae bacterium]
MKTDAEMTFGEHLEELRRRIILALLGVVVGAAICGLNYKVLLKALLVPYVEAYQALEKDKEKAGEGEPAPQPPTPAQTPAEAPPKDTPRNIPPPRVILGTPMTGYVTIILLSLICGTMLASPWVIYQIWAFIGVGLHPHERRHIHIFGPISFLLFIGGAALFYLYILRVALQALILPTADIVVEGIPVVDSSLFLNDYFRFVTWMTLVFGVVFQTPLVVLFLAKSGIVPLETLARQQKIVIVLMCVLAAVFTPPDPVTLVVMAVPLILLYEIGLLAAWLTRPREHAEEPA